MELGWIDFSKTERSKILSVLDLLSESGTLDELGIAPVRDGFSNLFFPGTTTIQTRAKYFFIVPYALKQLERSSETNPNRVFKALDAIEKTCGQTFLEQNSNENGIIGKRSLQSGGWVKRTPADIYWAVGNLHHSIATSMDVRTTIYTVDTFNSFKARANGGKEKATALRSHFAVAFTKGDGKEKDADRKKVIRNAFNSPFRPFVLASTSIGQEGLDFHNYCRRIVHWNLPSNPIDLEQREGRINRFECLAIRQNIAKRYGTVSFKKNIWKEMFDEAAKVENGGEGSDLIPFWGLTEKEDMVRIERIVPMYPFSRDELAYERLIKILSLYRLTLGQARQEELLEYIFKNCDDLDEMKNYFINLSPYYKKH